MTRRSSRKSRDSEHLTTTHRVGQSLRQYFITGLAALFPVFATLYLLMWLFKFADSVLGQMLGFKTPGLGLLLLVFIILAVGVFSIHFFGRVVFRTLEAWFSRLPLIKKIYPLVKQLAQFVFTENEQQAAFRRVVLVVYPRPGAYSLAFVTNEGKSSVIGPPQTLLTLLIPTPPSPFTGPIIIVPKDDVIPLQMSVEDALKFVVSGGIVAPPLVAERAP